MSQRQIDDLNAKVKLRIAPSPIHGVGVFAIRNIKKGSKLYADIVPCIYTLPYSAFNKLFSNVAQLLLERWPRIIDGSAFLYPDARFTAYLNHSDTPNYDAQTDLALTDIKQGEEVTEDYRKIPNYKQVYPFLDK